MYDLRDVARHGRRQGRQHIVILQHVGLVEDEVVVEALETGQLAYRQYIAPGYTWSACLAVWTTRGVLAHTWMGE